MEVFEQQKPAFVAVAGTAFIIDGLNHNVLRGMIQKIQKIRKFFRNGSLVCYSMDAKINNAGTTYCVFCDDAYRCQNKLRLAIMLIDGAQLKPVVIDVNHGSFDSLKRLLDDLGEKALPTTPVSMKIVYDDRDRRSIEFSA